MAAPFIDKDAYMKAFNESASILDGLESKARDIHSVKKVYLNASHQIVVEFNDDTSDQKFDIASSDGVSITSLTVDSSTNQLIQKSEGGDHDVTVQLFNEGPSGANSNYDKSDYYANHDKTVQAEYKTSTVEYTDDGKRKVLDCTVGPLLGIGETGFSASATASSVGATGFKYSATLIDLSLTILFANFCNILTKTAGEVSKVTATKWKAFGVAGAVTGVAYIIAGIVAGVLEIKETRKASKAKAKVANKN